MPALSRRQPEWTYGHSRNGVLYRRQGRHYEAWRDHAPAWADVRFFDGRGRPCLGPLPAPPRDPLMVAAERANPGAPWFFWLGLTPLAAILMPWRPTL